MIKLIRSAENKKRIFCENIHTTGNTDPRKVMLMLTYGEQAPYFEGLLEGKLLVTKCKNSSCKQYETFSELYTILCSDCSSKNTVINLTSVAQESATICAVVVTKKTEVSDALEKPIRSVHIEFSGVSARFVGSLIAENPKIGDRVVPIFNKGNPTYTILDLLWVPLGTPEDQLPKGYSL